CPKCGYQTIAGSDMPEFGRLLADQYRKKYGLLTSDEIRERRKRLEMNQEQFADWLGVGIASVKRWEMGKIQDKRSDALIRERTDPPKYATAQNAGWVFVNCGSTAIPKLVGMGLVDVAVVKPNPDPQYFASVNGYIVTALSDPEFRCPGCTHTNSYSTVLAS